MPPYIPVGFDHILPKGVDHILFCVGPALFVEQLGAYLAVTAFTAAHYVTAGAGARWAAVSVAR